MEAPLGVVTLNSEGPIADDCLQARRTDAASPISFELLVNAKNHKRADVSDLGSREQRRIVEAGEAYAAIDKRAGNLVTVAELRLRKRLGC